jgi:hypothetical protein
MEIESTTLITETAQFPENYIEIDAPGQTSIYHSSLFMIEQILEL